MATSEDKVVAVIMVGGPTKGSRFRQLSFNTPEPLFPLAGQPMVYYPISACKKVSNLAQIFLIGFYEEREFALYVSSVSNELKVPVRREKRKPFLQEVEKTVLARGREKRMETDTRTIEALPEDYSNWSSTVICFQEKDDEISVYAVNCDNGVSMYYVVSYQRNKCLYQKMGYTAGDFKVYFVGDFIFDEGENFLMHSLQVEVYDIPNRRWTSQS